jgi:bifunctional non-homologous end joining protein LigD
MLAKLAEMMRPVAQETSPFDVGRPPRGAHLVESRLVGESEFAEWTQAGDLRAPSFKGLRQDKGPRQVVRAREAHRQQVALQYQVLPQRPAPWS